MLAEQRKKQNATEGWERITAKVDGIMSEARFADLTLSEPTRKVRAQPK
jgi:hypothetical protein